MSNVSRRPQRQATIGPAQRWVLWLVIQALLALVLAAGPRAIGGPLHWHDGEVGHAGHDEHVTLHALARHAHAAEVEAVTLDAGAPSQDSLSHQAGASAAAALWPEVCGPLRVPSPARDPWPAARATTAWTDADLGDPDPPPRG